MILTIPRLASSSRSCTPAARLRRAGSCGPGTGSSRSTRSTSARSLTPRHRRRSGGRRTRSVMGWKVFFSPNANIFLYKYKYFCTNANIFLYKYKYFCTNTNIFVCSGDGVLGEDWRGRHHRGHHGHHRQEAGQGARPLRGGPQGRARSAAIGHHIQYWPPIGPSQDT